MTPFDLQLSIISSGAIVIGFIGRNQSLSSLLIIATVLLFTHFIMNELTYRFTWFKNLIIGRPEVIILNGKLHRRILRKFRITEDELYEALRDHEIMKSEDVKCAIMETDGKISVIKYNHGQNQPH